MKTKLCRKKLKIYNTFNIHVHILSNGMNLFSFLIIVIAIMNFEKIKKAMIKN